MGKWLGGVLAAFVVLMVASPAGAGVCTAAASPDPAWLGAEVTFSATGFVPGEDFVLYVGGGIWGAGSADSNGVAVFTRTVPDNWGTDFETSWYITNNDASCSTGGQLLILADPPPTTTTTTTTTTPPTTTAPPTTTKPPTATTTHVIVVVYEGTYAGPETNVIATPDVYKQSPSSARSEIEGVGLEYRNGGMEPTDDPSEDGVAVRQSPAVGTPVVEGATVTVWYGTYTPPTGLVPGVVGLSESAAIAQIEGAGFVAVYDGSAVSPGNAGDVIAQSPGGGTSLSIGSSVYYTLGVDPTFPSRSISSYASLQIQGYANGGHGTVHAHGSTITFVVSWGDPCPSDGCETFYEWDLTDLSTGGIFATESMGDGGIRFVQRTLTGSLGLRPFGVEIYRSNDGGASWESLGITDLWIYLID